MHALGVVEFGHASCALSTYLVCMYVVVVVDALGITSGTPAPTFLPLRNLHTRYREPSVFRSELLRWGIPLKVTKPVIANTIS